MFSKTSSWRMIMWLPNTMVYDYSFCVFFGFSCPIGKTLRDVAESLSH
jgi:hypothetical protein